MSVKHKTKYPSNYFFSNVKNQFYIESRINETHLYNPISTFEQKLNNEMKRISYRYGKIDSRQIFYPNKNNQFYWNTINDFDKYKTLKMIENRFEGEKNNNLKYKLKPLNVIEKGSLDNLSRNLFYFDKYNKKMKKIEKENNKKNDNNNENKILKKNSFIESREINFELKNNNNYYNNNNEKEIYKYNYDIFELNDEEDSNIN